MKQFTIGSWQWVALELIRKTNPLNKAIIILFFNFCCIALQSQVQISTTEFLKTATNEPEIQLENRKLEYLQKTNFALPLIDEIEIRTETDEFTWRRQEYLTRLSFNGYQEHLKQNDYHQSLIELGKADKQILFHEVLMDKYSQLLNYIFQIREIEQLEKEKLVLEDQIQVMRKLGANSTRFDLDDLVDAEADLFEIESDLLKMKGDLEYWNRAFSVDLNIEDLITIDTSNFLNINSLQQFAGQIFGAEIEHPKTAQRQKRVDMSISEYELEKAENKKIIDYLQLKYTGARNSQDFGEEWAIGAGIRIPTKSKNRLSLNELELERIEEENELQLYKIQVAETLQKTQNRLEILYKQYDLIKSQLDDSQANFALERLNSETQKNPLILLQIQENILNRQSRLLNVELDIFRTYLNILDLTGKASEVPLKNYFSNTLDSFQ